MQVTQKRDKIMSDRIGCRDEKMEEVVPPLKLDVMEENTTEDSEKNLS